jgi:hypothetical protein
MAIYSGYYNTWDHFRMQAGLPTAATAIKQLSTNAINDRRLHSTPGYLAVQESGGTFAGLFNSYRARCGPLFTWDGAKLLTNDQMSEMLDGNPITGECACFAQGLYMLAVLPAPLGLGIDHTTIKMELIANGARGFVSSHGTRFNPRVYGLLSNMTGPGRSPVNWPTNLRYWYDHKVLGNAGIHWDPCYGVSYDPATHNPMLYKLRDTIANEYVDADGPSGRTYHFRCFENESVFCGLGPRIVMQGPYDGPHP